MRHDGSIAPEVDAAGSGLMHRTGLALVSMACLGLVACGHPAPQVVSARGTQAFEVDLASDSLGLAIAWHGGHDGPAQIHVRSLDANGRADSDPVAVTHGDADAYEPSLQVLGDDYLVAWYEKPATGWATAWLARVGPAGGQRWRVLLPTPDGEGVRPVIRVRDGTIHAAWLEVRGDGTARVWSARFDSDGGERVKARSVAPASADTWNLNAALDGDGRLHVVYDAHFATRARELYHVRVADGDAVVTVLTPDDGHDSVYPDIDVAGQRQVLAWFDHRDGNSEVYLAAGRLDEPAATWMGRARRVTETPGDSIGAYVAWNRDRIGLAWSETVDGRAEVRLQTFAANLDADDPPMRLHQAPGPTVIPSLRPWRDGFAVAWNDYVLADRTAGHAGIVKSEARVALVDR